MATRSQSLKPGSKIAELFAFIKRELVGTELIITGEHIRQLAEQLKIGKIESVYGMLKQLEQKGLINRARRKGVKGIVVSFPSTQKEPETQTKQKRVRQTRQSKRSKRKSRRSSRIEEASPTLDDLISGLGAEILSLKEKLDSRTKLHDQLVVARAELKQR
jgi:hypothetical protein